MAIHILPPGMKLEDEGENIQKHVSKHRIVSKKIFKNLREDIRKNNYRYKKGIEIIEKNGEKEEKVYVYVYIKSK